MLLYLAAALISIMADNRYRSGALKRKLKNERQRREKESLSKLKTITGFFTPVTPQPDVPVLAERSVDNNLLEETAGADLISRAEQPISGLSSFQSEAMETATETVVKLKLVKNRRDPQWYIRNYINLTLMSIESDLLRKVDFTAKKSRRRHF